MDHDVAAWVTEEAERGTLSARRDARSQIPRSTADRFGVPPTPFTPPPRVDDHPGGLGTDMFLRRVSDTAARGPGASALGASTHNELKKCKQLTLRGAKVHVPLDADPSYFELIFALEPKGGADSEYHQLMAMLRDCLVIGMVLPRAPVPESAAGSRTISSMPL